MRADQLGRPEPRFGLEHVEDERRAGPLREQAFQEAPLIGVGCEPDRLDAAPREKLARRRILAHDQRRIDRPSIAQLIGQGQAAGEVAHAEIFATVGA